MDLSKLSQNEKMALYGAIVVFLAGVISNWGGLFWLAVLAAIGVAVVLFVPGINVGSKGTLLATFGLVALGSGIIELLRFLNYFVNTLTDFQTIAFVIALVGAAVMAYAGWSALQAEGGTWQFGTGSAAAAPPAPAAAAPPPAAPMAEPIAEPMAEPMADETPMGSDADLREDDRPVG